MRRRSLDEVVIGGIGLTPITRGTASSTVELHLAAALAALADAGVPANQIDGVVPHSTAGIIAEDLISNLGLSDVTFSATVHRGGASVLSSVMLAVSAVASGRARYVLITAGRRGYSEQRVSTRTTAPDRVYSDVEEYEIPFGNSVAMQWYAQAARRYMFDHDVPSEALARIALTTRRHANLNPGALMFEKTLSMGDYEKAPLLVSPFRVYDCSLESDGAGAIIIGAADDFRDSNRVVRISGFGEGHGDPPTSITEKKDLTVVDGLEVAARVAYESAGYGPDDVSCAQIYDGFTWFVLASLEALGMCPPGEAWAYIRDHGTSIDDRLPINTHGGLLSEGHVSGINHVVEAVRQLRGEVETARQVERCERVLVTGEGNFFEGSVMMLECPNG